MAPTSCADIAQMYTQAVDGEYWLHHGDGPLRLYCHNMTGIPRAYITLNSPENNYAENNKDGAHTKFSRVAVDSQVE